MSTVVQQLIDAATAAAVEIIPGEANPDAESRTANGLSKSRELLLY
jgi:hypothetical protein